MSRNSRLKKATALGDFLRPYVQRLVVYPLHPESRSAVYDLSWKNPWRKLEPGPLSFLMGQDTDLPAVLFLPAVAWHVRRQRTNHLAAGLAAQGHCCVHLNPYLGQQFPTLYWFDRQHRVSLLGERLLEFHVRLHREPVYHHRALAAAEVREIVRAVERLLEVVPARRWVQVTSFPIWRNVALELRARHRAPIVYDCQDSIAHFENLSDEIAGQEEKLLAECDAACFSSQLLLSRHATHNPSLRERATLIRNGADPDHFPFIPAGPVQGPKNTSGTIGYVGALDHWFDAAAVAEMARQFPQCRVQLIGRVEDRRIESLRSFRNVEFLGEVAYEDLPQLMRRFAVCLIPFQKSELTDAVNPIKLYEYFCTGLPVVATRLPEIELFEDLVYLAGSPLEFAAKVREALGESDPGLRLRRREIAVRESWPARVKALRSVVMHAAGVPPEPRTPAR